MAELSKKFKKIIKGLETKIKDEEQLEYVKTQIFELYNMLFDQIEKLEEIANERVTKLLEVQAGLEEKLDKLEKNIKEVQEDIYGDDSDFSISCPYCNEEFVMEGIESKEEIECPECNNVIELDWGSEEEESGCGGGCGGCGSGCHGHAEDDDM